MRKLLLSLMMIIVIVFSNCKSPTETSNTAPSISEIQMNASEATTSSEILLTAIATDKDGDAITYTWNCDKGTLQSTTGQTVRWQTPSSPTTAIINLVCSDGKSTTNFSKNVSVVNSVGNLYVKSTPSNADILLDNSNSGKKTPYTFTNITGGIKKVTLYKEGYASDPDSIIADIKNKETFTATFTLVASAKVQGNVYYSGTKIPISGVTVSVGSKKITTGSDGKYLLDGIKTGTYQITATKIDYDNYTKSISLMQGDNSYDIDMTSGIYTKRVYGYVKNGINKGIQGVQVELLNEDGTTANIKDQSDANGLYQLPAVPQGTRKLKFSKNTSADDGFLEGNYNVFITNADRQFDVTLLAKKLSLPYHPFLAVDSLNGNKLAWYVKNTESLYGFNIYRAQNLAGPFSKLNTQVITVTTNPPNSSGNIVYQDITANNQSYFYKISVVNTNPEEGVYSPEVLVPSTQSTTYIIGNTRKISGTLSGKNLVILDQAILRINGQATLNFDNIWIGINSQIDASSISSDTRGSNGLAGASYGGKGGAGIEYISNGNYYSSIKYAAEPYGTANGQDIDLGSCSSPTEYGCAGGGKLIINAINLLNHWVIKANGQAGVGHTFAGNNPGGGSGGGILINCSSLINRGTISAEGGIGVGASISWGYIWGGGGSGGRIKIFSNFKENSGTISAKGGSGSKPSSQSYEANGQNGTVVY